MRFLIDTHVMLGRVLDSVFFRLYFVAIALTSTATRQRLMEQLKERLC